MRVRVVMPGLPPVAPGPPLQAAAFVGRPVARHLVHILEIDRDEAHDWIRIRFACEVRSCLGGVVAGSPAGGMQQLVALLVAEHPETVGA